MQNSAYQKITSIKNLDNNQYNDRSIISRNSSKNLKNSYYSNKTIITTYLSDKTFERSKKGRRINSKTEEDLKQMEQIWQSRENDSKQQDGNKFSKSSELDTLIAIAFIIILFCLALHLAPNQFYQGQQ